MRTTADSLADIARLLERAMELPADAHPLTLKGLLIQAHTIAVIRCVRERRKEALAELATFLESENARLQ